MLLSLRIKIIGNASQTQIIFANIKICFFFYFPNSSLFVRLTKFKVPSGRTPASKSVNAFSLPQKNLMFLIKNINSNPDTNNIFHCLPQYIILAGHCNIQNLKLQGISSIVIKSAQTLCLHTLFTKPDANEFGKFFQNDIFTKEHSDPLKASSPYSTHIAKRHPEKSAVCIGDPNGI